MTDEQAELLVALRDDTELNGRERQALAAAVNDHYEVKALVEAGYANEGLHFNSLRRIGDLVGADVNKIGGS